jgi:hypothetical protein
MRSLFAAGLSVFMAATFCSAQFRGAGTGALGGTYASPGISRPLGGIGPSFPGAFRFGQNQNSRGRYGTRSGLYPFPYAYSVYVPGYFDSLGDQGYYPPASVPPPLSAAGNPPVIINQFFGPQDSGQGFAPGFVPGDQNGNPIYPSPAPQPPPAAGVNAPQPGGPLSPAQNYYLIAYKDHSVYAVLAYWLEGNTLNYVTTQNTHNQASLNLIDLDLTKTLNQARSVPFSLPGK